MLIDDKTQIAEAENAANDESSASVDGIELARWSRSGVVVSGELAQGFVRMLRYLEGGHPAVLNALARAALIPQRLTLTFGTGENRRIDELTVDGVETTPDSPLDALQALTLRPADSAARDIDALLDGAAARSASAIVEEQAPCRIKIDAAFAEGRVFEGWLGYLEWSLMFGTPMEPLSKDQLAAVKSDAAVQQFVGIAAAQTKGALTAALPILAELRASAGSKDYVLKIYEANYRSQLGQRDEPVALFGDVLAANPLLPGVYKDLGDLYFAQGDTSRAWRCWDSGRRLAPDVELFEAVKRFEQQMVRQHPEYF